MPSFATRSRRAIVPRVISEGALFGTDKATDTSEDVRVPADVCSGTDFRVF